jgi:hypothetical protein
MEMHLRILILHSSRSGEDGDLDAASRRQTDDYGPASRWFR